MKSALFFLFMVLSSLNLFAVPPADIPKVIRFEYNNEGNVANPGSLHYLVDRLYDQGYTLSFNDSKKEIHRLSFHLDTIYPIEGLVLRYFPEEYENPILRGEVEFAINIQVDKYSPLTKVPKPTIYYGKEEIQIAFKKPVPARIIKLEIKPGKRSDSKQSSTKEVKLSLSEIEVWNRPLDIPSAEELKNGVYIWIIGGSSFLLIIVGIYLTLRKKGYKIF